MSFFTITNQSCIFFYTQAAFVFHIDFCQIDFYIIDYNIVTLYRLLLLIDFDIFHESFFCSLSLLFCYYLARES